MGQSYPDVPAEPLDTSRELPNAINLFRTATNRNANYCPICGERYVTWHGLDGGGSPGTPPPPNFPHIAYGCGGVWRDVGGGVWSGRCMAPVKQLEIVFEEEPV